MNRCIFLVLSGEGHRENMTSGRPVSWSGQRATDGSSPSPSPRWKRFSRKTTLREEGGGETAWTVDMTEPPRKPSGFWAGHEDVLILQLPKTSLIKKSSCWLNLPPTDPQWPASCFHPSLPSEYGGQFRISRGNPPGFEPTITEREHLIFVREAWVFFSPKLNVHFTVTALKKSHAQMSSHLTKWCSIHPEVDTHTYIF